MHSLHPRFLLTFASFLASVFAAGWSLDTTSCSDPKIQQQIRDSMKWVFDRADDALAQLNKDPMNIDVGILSRYDWADLARYKIYITGCGPQTKIPPIRNQPSLRLSVSTAVTCTLCRCLQRLRIDFTGTYQAIAGMRQEVPKAPFDPTTAVCSISSKNLAAVSADKRSI